MSIKVRYFGSLKEHVGRSDDSLIGTPLSIKEAWRQLNPDLNMPDTLLAAVNLEYVPLDADLKDGDELAFFPPVTGG